jgi:hypothetical protein
MFLEVSSVWFCGSQQDAKAFKESDLVAGITVQVYLQITTFALFMKRFLVGTFIFHNTYGIILPIDELIFFKMVETTSQVCNLNSD